jgi:predicted DNA-binding protein YlxM (UPF0122 family)
MRQYIYKVIVIIVATILIFEFTIGKTINKFEKKMELVLSKEGRKDLVTSIKKEMQKAVDKENYLSNEERILINNFILKIQKELDTKIK